MDMFKLGSGDSNKPKLHSDPFNKKSFHNASIFIGYHSKNPLSYMAKVAFKRGDTSGEQQFRGDSMQDLLSKMDAFMQSLD